MRKTLRIHKTLGQFAKLKAASALMTLAIGLVSIVALQPAHAQAYKVVHSFTGAPFDGSDPLSALVQGADGNLYGTTAQGGTSNSGTIFKLDKSGNETVLHSFAGGAGGSAPKGGLFRDPSGNLFGTASQGGTSACACGTVFELDANNVFTTLYSFRAGSDGAGPSDTLVSSGGVLYGTTQFGGKGCSSVGGCGTIFKVTKTGQETILYRFAGLMDGFQPLGLIRDAAGNFYGATIAGTNNFGTIFKLDTTRHFIVLHTFTGAADGAGPSGRLIRDVSGNIRGGTQAGGDPTCYCGVIFRIDAAGNFKVLHTFFARTGGAEPVTGPLDVSGVLYGSTAYGGNLNCMAPTTGCGVLYQIGNTGQYSVLHRFAGGNDGELPFAALALGADSSIYGTTSSGGTGTACGSTGCGTIFKYTPGTPSAEE